jgi:predicted Zn-dependent protease
MSVNAHQYYQSFLQAKDIFFNELKSNESLTLNYNGEESYFVRFNKSKVRQTTQVDQINIAMELMIGNKKSHLSLPLKIDCKSQAAQLKQHFLKLRKEVESLPDDPFIVPLKNNGESHSETYHSLPNPNTLVEDIIPPISHLDMAGQLVSGLVFQANANSLGQSHWFGTESFYFDYSLYTEKEKAVKGLYSDYRFDKNTYQQKIEENIKHLNLMNIDNKVVPKGKYRCYFAPEAVAEMLGTFNWAGISAEAFHRGESPLGDLESKERKLSEKFSLTEDFTLNMCPQFNEYGENSDEQLALIQNGELKQFLTSSRTAKEYNLTSNYATESEFPRSPVIATGDLKQEEILKELGTGLFISNLHYLNWSDRQKGRMTGMTRFACFWVEDGKIVAPIKDLRFDDSFYNFWGPNLMAITDFSHIIPSINTYGLRQIGGCKVPGMLVENFEFTL